MTPELWARVKKIFTAALDRPGPERAEWVVNACAGDETLLSEVRKLLHAHETGNDFLESPPPLDDDLDALPEGSQLGSYRIIRQVGRGGMGIVYLAWDEDLERNVALKTIRPILAADERLQQRLRREARVSAAIEHPAIARVYKLEVLDGRLVIVSEYVSGDTLREIIGGGPLSTQRARLISQQIAEALAAAHEAGIVHRDLKPENVIVTRDDKIKVVDFGIAFIETPGMTGLTHTGAAIGTPKYMPPEQLAGETVDARADVYAFGVVLSELFGTRDALTGKATLSDPQIRQIVDVCVSRDPAARYASGSELVRVLGAAPPGSPQSERGPLWWWEFHQITATVVYGMTIWPAWLARQIVGGLFGPALFVATLIAVIVAGSLRWHLWFTSRFYADDLRWARKREGRWIRMADWLFVGSLAASSVMVGEKRALVAIILIAIAAGAAVAFLAIERTTARAAFFTKEARRSKSTKGTKKLAGENREFHET
jgi:hypothetical protein